MKFGSTRPINHRCPSVSDFWKVIHSQKVSIGSSWSTLHTGRTVHTPHRPNCPQQTHADDGPGCKNWSWKQNRHKHRVTKKSIGKKNKRKITRVIVRNYIYVQSVKCAIEIQLHIGVPGTEWGCQAHCVWAIAHHCPWEARHHLSPPVSEHGGF